MDKRKKLFISLIVISMVLSFAYMNGSFDSAYADSLSLTLKDAQGSSLTVGSVNVSANNANLTVDIVTDSKYPMNYSQLDFSHNSGGIFIAASDGHTEYFTEVSSNHHRYIIPRSEIKHDNVVVNARADVYISEEPQRVKKAFVNVCFEVPPCVTTTTTKPCVSTTETTQTTTTQPSVSTTETTQTTTTEQRGGGGATSSTVGGVTTVFQATTTTQAGVTTSTEKPEEVTTTEVTVLGTTVGNVTRNRLPFTGINTNWYLVGLLLMASGLWIYIGSLKRTVRSRK